MYGLPFPLFGDPAAASPALVPIADETASNQASLDITWTLDFEKVFVLVSNFAPAGGDTSLDLRTSSDGGATFDAGASDYRYQSVMHVSGLVPNWSNAAAFIRLTPNGTNNGMAATTAEAALLVTVQRPFDTGSRTVINSHGGYSNNIGNASCSMSHGLRDVAARVDGLRFFQNTGNLLAGRFLAWGELPP